MPAVNFHANLAEAGGARGASEPLLDTNAQVGNAGETQSLTKLQLTPGRIPGGGGIIRGALMFLEPTPKRSTQLGSTSLQSFHLQLAQL